LFSGIIGGDVIIYLYLSQISRAAEPHT